jgi:capsular exopolysaccharide synthesis family protein
LYLFLLQKREESILSNAVRVEKAKIIDSAFSDGEVVSPKKLLVYLGSIILGLTLPFSIVYVQNLLDTKVRGEKDLKNLGIPYIGDIPKIRSSKSKFIQENDNSNLAEAFRYLRTNINFILQEKSGCKTVFITSTESGEGKTFLSINLANSFAISGKKTLLIAMDLRAPKMIKYLNIQGKHLGVSNFVKDPYLTLDDIVITKTKFENLDIINSGDIPPNPVELLMDSRVFGIFEEAKTIYDYIIVDSAPVGMVTDTIQIASQADLTLYVIKADTLDKRMLHIPENLNKQKKLKNMSFLINGSDHAKSTYGYGYSYSYGKESKKSWFQRLKDNYYKSAAV